MADNYKYKNYICKGKNNKLVLHDFIYEMFYRYKLSGKDNLNDFALDLVNKIAPRMHIWKIHHNEINSSTLDFYISLFKYIEKNGGLKNCDKLSEYTYNINSIESFQEVVNSGKIIKEEFQINNQEQIQSTKNNIYNDKKLLITNYSIIRDSNGYLILPDELLDTYKSFDGDNSYQFANYAIKKLSGRIENIDDELFRYYAAIYTLIEKEKVCFAISEFCNMKGISNTKESIKKMLHTKQIKRYDIKMNINGSISETLAGDSTAIENSSYNLNYLNMEDNDTNGKKEESDEKNTSQELKLYIQSGIIEIENTLKQVTNNINIKTEKEYNDNKKKLKDIKIKIQKIYQTAQNNSTKEFSTNINIINNTEKKYKEINTKIDKLSAKLEKINTELNQQQDKERTDYYEQIQSKLENFEAELNSISQNLSVNTEKEYLKKHSNLTNLRDKLHDFYTKSIKEAHQNSSLTGPLIKEATTKHNELMNNIDSKIKELEEEKKKLLFKNLFNG